MKLSITFILLILSINSFSQADVKRVLFLGNSYVYSNDLPKMLADVASSVGDSVYYDSNTPGGYTLQGHASNAISLEKIAIGNWDYVVLQEQSQQPSLPIENVEADVFPYAKILDSTINADNECPETVFYMTWGRKFGDQENCWWWPPVCTYEGQDSLVNLRYRMMADSNDAIISPVGQAWRYIRENYPTIELYKPDSTHPSPSGSYVAACCFYTVIFRKDPTLITYDYLVSAANAEIIRNVVKLIAYDSLDLWHVGEYDPFASYSYFESGTNEISFINNSANGDVQEWDFGDDNSSTTLNPVHVYAAPGYYNVTLSVSNCFDMDVASQIVEVTTAGTQIINSELPEWQIIQNPAGSTIQFEINSLEDISYSIFDLNGKELQSMAINSQSKQIDISSLPVGFYILKFYRNNISIGEKEFVKALN